MVRGAPTEPWAEMVRIAARSPSTHNTQGWRLRPEGPRAAVLCFDRRRTLPAEDRDGAFNVVNMGVFIRALEIAAASLDHRLRWELDLDEGSGDPVHARVARLEVEPGPDPRAAARLPALRARRTGRYPYDGRPIPVEDLRRLQALTADAGHTFGWTQDPDEIQWLMELNARTIADDLQVRSIRRELHEWTRFTRRQAERTGDGLWAKCMNQGPVGLWLTLRFPWILRLGPVRRAAVRRYLAAQGGTATIAWISGPVGERGQQLEAGRMMLEWWLELTELGIDMLPYGSLYTRPEAWKMVADRIGAPRWWIVVRMGYGPTPPRSFRLPPANLWIER